MITAEFKIDWQGPRAARNMLSAILHGIEDGANFMADRIRDNISVQGPPASTPGEYPHLDTGELHDSVRVIGNRAKKSFRIVADAEHAGPVEEKRPFLRRTYLENKPQLRRVVLDRARARYGHFRLG